MCVKLPRLVNYFILQKKFGEGLFYDSIHIPGSPGASGNEDHGKGGGGSIYFKGKGVWRNGVSGKYCFSFGEILNTFLAGKGDFSGEGDGSEICPAGCGSLFVDNDGNTYEVGGKNHREGGVAPEGKNNFRAE